MCTARLNDFQKNLNSKSTDQIRNSIIENLKTIYDPEIPVNIWELGLIYKIDVDDAGMARIDMTLTAPNCPAAESLPEEVKFKTKSTEGVTDAEVIIVWEPSYNMSMMSEAAKLQLGMM